MKTSTSASLMAILSCLACIALLDVSYADDPKVDNPIGETGEDLGFVPFAKLEIVSGSLSAQIPATRSSASNRVRFVVRGNVPVKVNAEPDAEIKINGQTFGKAVKGGTAIGYRLVVQYPLNSGTTLVGGVVGYSSAAETEGTIQLVTDSSWSSGGAMPDDGTYVGEVMLTLTPDF